MLPHFGGLVCRGVHGLQNAGALAELRHLVERVRSYGHLDAHWDPLKIWKRRYAVPLPPCTCQSA